MALSFTEQEEQKEKFLSDLYEKNQKEEKRKENVNKILEEEGISSEKKASRHKIYDEYVAPALQKTPGLADNIEMVSHLFLTGMDKYNEEQEKLKNGAGKTTETETDGKTTTETKKPNTPQTTTKTDAPQTDVSKALNDAYDKMSDIEKQSFDNMISLYEAGHYKRKK